MLSGQLAEGSYIHTRRTCRHTQSLWDWWKTRAEVNGGLTERSFFLWVRRPEQLYCRLQIQPWPRSM
jgi:hypothetical protein